MQPKKYDEDFKKSIVTLYENGKTQSELSREYGVSLSASVLVKKSCNRKDYAKRF